MDSRKGSQQGNRLGLQEDSIDLTRQLPIHSNPNIVNTEWLLVPRGGRAEEVHPIPGVPVAQDPLEHDGGLEKREKEKRHFLEKKKRRQANQAKALYIIERPALSPFAANNARGTSVTKARQAVSLPASRTGSSQDQVSPENSEIQRSSKEESENQRSNTLGRTATYNAKRSVKENNNAHSRNLSRRKG
jgi:hypothetical protein